MLLNIFKRLKHKTFIVEFLLFGFITNTNFIFSQSSNDNSNNNTKNDLAQDYYQFLVLSIGSHGGDYVHLNQELEKMNLQKVSNPDKEWGLNFQFKPFYSTDSIFSFMNKTFMGLSFKTNYMFKNIDIRQFIFKVDYGIEQFITDYFGFCVQAGLNFNYSYLRIKNQLLQTGDEYYYFSNIGIGITNGIKFFYLIDPKGVYFNLRNVIPLLELEINSYSTNIFSSEDGNTYLLYNGNNDNVKDLCYLYPLGLSLHLNLGMRF